jgi:hypothetical protein
MTSPDAKDGNSELIRDLGCSSTSIIKQQQLKKEVAVDKTKGNTMRTNQNQNKPQEWRHGYLTQNDMVKDETLDTDQNGRIVKVTKEWKKHRFKGN